MGFLDVWLHLNPGEIGGHEEGVHYLTPTLLGRCGRDLIHYLRSSPSHLSHSSWHYLSPSSLSSLCL